MRAARRVPGTGSTTRNIVLGVVTVALLTLLPAAASGANIAPNPGFEVDCSGVPCSWSPAERTTTIARDTRVAHAGAASMAVTVTDSLGAGTSCVSATPDTYVASYWYRATTATVSAVQAVVGFFSTTDCTGGPLLQFTLPPTQLITDGNWYQHIGTISAPQGTQSVRVSLQVGCEVVGRAGDAVADDLRSALQPCGAPTTAWFDDVVLDQRPQCSNFADDDLDGFADYPADPECTSPSDDNEFPDAACSNGIDDDADNLTDYPTDPGCQSASDTSEINPTFSVADVTVTEGNAATTNANFVVTKAGPSDTDASVNFATADGTATAPSDYQTSSGSLRFAPNQTQMTVVVPVNGDTVVEPNETFTINLSSAANAVIGDGQGVGTITNDDQAAGTTLAIRDVTIIEGNSGTTNASFAVVKSGQTGNTVGVSYATANQTATAPSDYQTTSGSLSFAPNETEKIVTVPVVGDTAAESNETFAVNLSAPTNATISDAQGIGTITNDDGATTPTLSIGDVSVTEGNSGTTNATFSVTKTGVTAATVGVSYATADQSALAPSDYQALNGSLSFAPAETQKTITVAVAGDTVDEATETFAVSLSAPTNATIADGQGIGTIIDDDVATSELVEVVDNPATEPPPLIPSTRTINVNVRGSGTVVSLGRRGTQGSGQGVEQIRCGIQGLSCQETTDVTQQVTVGARSSTGYRFDHWEGSCAGDQLTCQVTTSQTRTIAAVFVPTNPGAANLRFRVGKATIRAKWVQSFGKGTLRVRGSVAQRALVRLRLHRPHEGPLLNRKKRVGPGSFGLKAALRQGKLLRGATLLPGGFVVALRGKAGSTGLPLQVRTVSIRGPREGVVRNAFASASRNGVRQSSLPAGATEAWATFRFSTQPRTGTLFVRWRYPNKTVIGESRKNNRPLIKSGIGGNPIPPGVYRAELVASGRVVRRLNIKVG